ncbi:uncharacterized protein [Maniola hyperantus]|uniref:uncharacterized protein isoform X2 n=1 Tax=Aphantopus hyperantus TaxID=2795564 RepID=UPI0021204D61
MANHWDSEYAIWRDLSVAQGREVPAEIEHTVAKDERPPRVVLTEETEEQFFGNYVDAAGDYSSGPDLSLIKQMLQEAKVSQTEEEHIVIEKTVKPARKKNMAIESILHMYANCGPLQNGHCAVNPSTSEANLLCNSPNNMFKKKIKKVDSSRSPKNTPSTVIDQSASELEQPRMFVPSSRAAEYYRKYQEQSQALERAREDVWARAEREMRELDQKKLQATSRCDPNNADTPAHGADAVRLSTHRHSFTDTKDCVVCKVLCTHTEQTKTNNEPK